MLTLSAVRNLSLHGGWTMNRMGLKVSRHDADPITSVQQTRDGNAVLVSTLDSTIRLMDKGNGNLLQSYRGHANKDYRIRSCLGLGDSVVVSGSEDGHIYAWDLLGGKVIQKLKAHDGKVASAVAFNAVRKEWASAGVDCRSACAVVRQRGLTMRRYCQCLGFAIVSMHEIKNPHSSECWLSK